MSERLPIEIWGLWYIRQSFLEPDCLLVQRRNQCGEVQEYWKDNYSSRDWAELLLDLSAANQSLLGGIAQ